jgi:iron-sulfur cluster assembly protein
MLMLVLTDNATSVIRALADRPEMPEQSGLRIASTQDGAGALTITTVDTPEAGDQVLEDQGARVFLEPMAAEMLDDKVLDATLTDEGRVQFLVATQ